MMSSETPTFPDTYGTIDTERLLDVYGRGPARLRGSVEGLSDEALRARPIAGKWSIHELVVHVSDSEMVGAVRMRMVLAGPDGVRLPGYDQDEWSRRLGYRSLDAAHMDHALAAFAELRAATLPLLTAATPEAWSRSGVHPARGRVTLRNLLELYADHSERHIEQIVDRRERLGSAIELPPLLRERLY